MSDEGHTTAPKLEPTMGRRVTIGATWLLASRFSLRILGLVSTIVVARILFPEDFGLIALATAVLGIAEGITALGFDSALIKFQSEDRADYDTAWTLNLIRGVILFAAISVCAVYLPSAFDEPRIGPIIHVIAFIPMLKGLQNPKFINLTRDLEFSRVFVLSIGAKLLSVITVIVIAVIWQTYWALVAGQVVMAASQMVLGYILYPFLPRLRLTSTNKLFGFSIWLAGHNFANSISHNADKLIVGGLVDVKMTGNYYMGQEISVLLTRELFEPIASVLFPGFAKSSDNLEKLRLQILDSIGVIAGVGFPIAVGFAFVADEFVHLVFGNKWNVIIPMVELIAPILGLQTISFVVNSAMLSIGATRALFMRAITYLFLRIGLLCAGGLLFGFVGVYVAHGISLLLFVAISYAMLIRFFGYTAFAPLKAAQRSFLSVATMSAVLFAGSFVIPERSSEAPLVLCLYLAAKALVGAITYFGVHWFLWQRAKCPEGVETRIIAMVAEIFKASQRFRPT